MFFNIVFLTILENSQENACIGVTCEVAEPTRGISCEISETFKSTFFQRTPQVAASVTLICRLVVVLLKK